MSIKSFIRSILGIKPKPEMVKIPWFSDKHYHQMTSKEKRQYKAWLRKNNYWDGAILAENAIRK